ncbi:hypothetical protein [Leisingera sp. McT4-56]|uniref:hypothetical protein n=1 Tax=Leisingera sp. McT4-56 TaxID=2881255 RepID=UPI001CF81DE9|nr:hypothetical protein [Leisingera sp. McT4-56]MCB4454704.1 hypothetical protein [Leisingera sp. McT4-56]
MRKHFLNAAVIVTALSSITTYALAEEILLEGTKPKVTVHSEERLKGKVKKQFTYFKKNADFYGALYLNIQEDVGGEFWDTRNMELAKQTARKSCHLKSQNPSNCQLYATVGPKSPSNGKGITLSQAGNRLFRKYQMSHKDGTFSAFATTEYGAPGYSRNQHSEIEARATAIRFCEQSVEQINKNTGAHLVQNVMSDESGTCRVIHVTKP